MNNAKHWIVLIIIGVLAFSFGCVQDAEIDEEVTANDNSEYVEEIDRLTVENQRLISEATRLETEKQQLSDDMRQLLHEAEISQQNHLLYQDLMKQEGWDLLETEPLDSIWTELLSAYNRFIPDFENIQELEDKELVEASRWLLYNLEFDFVEGNRFELRGMDGIPEEYLDILLTNVFQRTVDLKPYSENGVVKLKAASYHGYFHPKIITLYQRGDLYHAVLDIYVMAEDSGVEKEEFVEMIEAGQARKGYSTSMILKGLETSEGRFIQILSKRIVWTESRTLPTN